MIESFDEIEREKRTENSRQIEELSENTTFWR